MRLTKQEEITYKIEYLRNENKRLHELLDEYRDRNNCLYDELQLERARANWYRDLAFPDRTKWKWVVYK